MFDTLQYNSIKCAFQYELNSSVTMATYCVSALPILEAFLATFAVPFWSLLTALHMHDPASIFKCKLKFVALFNIFQAENH